MARQAITQIGKPLLLAAYLLSLTPSFVERTRGIEDWPGLILYALLFAGTSLALVATGYVRRSAIRLPLAVLLAIAAWFSLIYTGATTQFLSYDGFINMVRSAGFAQEAIAQNGHAILSSLLAPVLLLLGLALPPPSVPTRARYAPILSLPLAMALLTGILFLRGGEGARGLPDSYAPLSYALLMGYEAVMLDTGPRQPVTMQPQRRTTAHIVLIVDESVTGRYLDINSETGVPTPLSQAWPGVTIRNFGVAAAVTTCSIGSNVTLRHGGTRGDYRRINATLPPIWAYAKRSGRRTVYIDGQRNHGRLQNRMTQTEAAMIDRFVQFDDVPVQRRDMAIAARLTDLLRSREPLFIMVNKVGAHFPVHDKFPDSMAVDKPMLPRGTHLDIADTGNRTGFEGQPEDWRRYRNSYRNTLRWNVGMFFEQLRKHADLSNTIMLYTSDHGQNLHEDGGAGLSTHCNPDPVKTEGEVPLVMLTGHRTTNDAPGATPSGQASHYQVFPTLLHLMGYAKRDIAPVYGMGLDSEAPDPGTFNARFNARLNRQPVWRRIGQ